MNCTVICKGAVRACQLIKRANKVGYAFTRMRQTRGEHCGTRPIYVFNTLTQQKELFSPESPVVTWYSCGPTVYDEIHIGHASCYIRQDAIRRVLSKFQSKPLIYALGVTDVDDKIIQRARMLKEHESIISRAYEKQFFDSLQSLNVVIPDMVLRVSDWIPQIIKIVSKLIEKGHAYVSEKGNVFFDVASFPASGKFDPQQSQDKMKHGKDHPEKKSRVDFALWKAKVTDYEISWESPWGKGRPGWHIECSAFCDILSSGSPNLVVHSGGMDLKFPHHNNEICQSEAYYGVNNWAQYFLHMGILVLSNSSEKMSKSLNNFISVPVFLDKFGSADELRVTCLRRDYKRSIVYSPDDLVMSRNILMKIGLALEKCRDVVVNYHQGVQLEGSPCTSPILENTLRCQEQFETALCDDFDFPTALEILQTFCEACLENETVNVIEATVSRQFILSCLDLFGIQMNNANAAGSGSSLEHAESLHKLQMFRDRVRDFALGKHLDNFQEMSKEELRSRATEFKSLLKECDDIRVFIDSMNYRRIKDS